MIAHSVKGGGAEDRIDLGVNGQRSRVGDDQLNAPIVRLQIVARHAHHVRRQIDTDDAPVWQFGEQQLSQSTGPTAHVDHALASAEREAREHGSAPFDMGFDTR
jgi:hypothetical protein